MITPEQLTGLAEAEYVEIIRYIILQYENLDTNFVKLSSDHENLHAMYEGQMSAIKETFSQKLNNSQNLSQNISSNSVGAFEVVEEAVKELSLQHEEEIRSLIQAKDEEIQSITNSLVSHDNGYFIDQIKELKTCITELTEYMSRDIKFVPPSSTTDLCSAAKHFIISNHAVSIAEMESKHMVEIDQLKVDWEEKLKDLEMSHAYSRGDLEAKYDQILLDKEDQYQERLRCLDEQVYCLESELTMLKGEMTKAELSAEQEGIESELRSSSNEFFVHVTEHASPPPLPFTDSNRYKEEKQEILTTPKQDTPRRSVSSGVQRSQSLKHPKKASNPSLNRRNSVSGIRPPRQRHQRGKQAGEAESEHETKPTKLKPVKGKPNKLETDNKTGTIKMNSMSAQTQSISAASQTIALITVESWSQTDGNTEVRGADRQIFVVGKFCAVRQSSGLWLINPPRVRESV